MPIDASDEAALEIARFITDQLDDSRPVTDFLGPDPVQLTEALDSLALLELVTYVEDAFAVELQDDEIVPENFATVDAIVRLLLAKGAVTVPPAPGAADRESAHS